MSKKSLNRRIVIANIIFLITYIAEIILINFAHYYEEKKGLPLSTTDVPISLIMILNIIGISLIVMNFIINILLAIKNRKDIKILVTFIIIALSIVCIFFNKVVFFIIYFITNIIELIFIHMPKDDMNVSKKNNIYFIIYIILSISFLATSCITSYIVIKKVNSITNEQIEQKNEINNEKIELENRIIESFTATTNIVDYFPAYSNGKWGYIDKNGKEKIPCIYDSASEFEAININAKIYNIAVVEQNDSYILISQNNERIQLEENSFPWIIVNPMLRISVLFSKDFAFESQDEEGINNILHLDIDNDGYIYRNENNYIKFTYYDSYGGYSKADIFNIIVSKNGQETISRESIPITDSEVLLYDDGYIPFCDKENKVQGWYDKELNKVVLQGNYEILEVRNNIAVVKNLDENIVYFIDSSSGQVKHVAGNVIIYKDVYVAISQDEKWTLLDNNINTVSKEYDYILTNLALEQIPISDQMCWYE